MFIYPRCLFLQLELKGRAFQEAMLEIKQKYEKNEVLKAKNLKEGGTAIDRNRKIGGHKA
jgi:DNA polymerase V